MASLDSNNMKKHANIPIFIPHYGCPNACVFCNQVRITGKPSFTDTDVRREIDNALKTLGNDINEVEIAFFGGSFTAIPRDEMLALLTISDEYLKDGRISSVRLSTRPDAIDEDILEILKKHGVGTIELGIQSTSPDVLSVCKRGHTAEHSKNACELIKKHDFNLIGQMMVGLPHSTVQDELNTARDIINFGADGARIYPTVVLAGTELSRMEKAGSYAPLTVEDATERCAQVLDIFFKNNLPVIRIGLCANEILEAEASHDSYHAAIGELVRARVFRKRMEALIELHTDLSGQNIIFAVPKGKISQAVGQKKSNIEYLKKKFRLNSVKIIEDEMLDEFDVMIDIEL